MKILSIGNSFSEDAQRYLHSVAKANGDDFYTVNLCIGGCSLESHSRNIRENNRYYVFQENGVITEQMMTIEEGLKLEDWDVVTIQQVSNRSFNEESYYPYIFDLAECIRAHAPGAKLLIHETWAYEERSERIVETFGNPSADKMFSAIEKAYTRAKNEVNADAIIPSGELFIKLSHSEVEKIHRDTFHAAWGIGRYALALLWYHVLTGKSVLNISYSDFDEPVSEREIEIVKKYVEEFNKII